MDWIDPTEQGVWKLLIWMMILGCVALGVVLFFVPVMLDWDQWLLALKIRMASLGLWVVAASAFGLMWAVEWIFDL